MPDQTTAATTAAMTDLTNLWDAETARVSVDWDELSAIWEVRLLWLTDRHVPHGADWAEYCWTFSDNILPEALGAALAWCRALDQFRQCDTCGGAGWYWEADHRGTNMGERIRSVCEDCEGTGLAKR